MGEGSVDVSETSSAEVIELDVLVVGSAAIAMWPVVIGDMEVCVTSHNAVSDTIAEVERSAAGESVIFSDTLKLVGISPRFFTAPILMSCWQLT